MKKLKSDLRKMIREELLKEGYANPSADELNDLIKKLSAIAQDLQQTAVYQENPTQRKLKTMYGNAKKQLENFRDFIETNWD